jgi:hypothetical protein
VTLHPALPASDAGDTPSGVFDADPMSPPPPPLGARAIEIRDVTGRVICYAWVIAEHADDQLASTAWRWLDEHNATARPPRHLALHRDSA